MDELINVYAITSYWEDGSLEFMYNGFGYEDENGIITWKDGYEPPENDEHYSTKIVKNEEWKSL